MKENFKMKALNQKKGFSAILSMLMTLGVCHSVSVQASDIDIYQSSTGGKTSILLMLDTSGSMGMSSLVLPKTNQYGSPGDVDTSLCSRVTVKEYTNNRTDSGAKSFNEWAYNLTDTRSTSPTYNKTSIYKTVTIGTTIIPYYVRGCTNGTLTQYDRLSRLKDAIIPLLASNDLSNDVIMGLGNFSSKTNLNVGDSAIKLVDGHSGSILVPNSALTTAQRINIARAIADFKSLDTTTNEDGTSNSNLKISSTIAPYTYEYKKSASGTPTAQAYAEAGAYLMGTNTGSDATQATLNKISYVYDGYMLMQQIADPYEQAYFICVQLGAGLTKSAFNTSGNNDVKQCINNWPSRQATAWNSNREPTQWNDLIDQNTIKNGIYRPDGTKIQNQTEFKNEVGALNNGWETLSKLPEGWRYGGWMKVNNEPLDIEPVVGTVWGPYANGSAFGMVSYRTNPFALIEQPQASPNLYTDNLVGGMRYSASTSMHNGNYIAGGSTSSCDGNGIYFLTDGAPNSTKDLMAQTIMNTTLTSDYAFVGKPSGTGVLVSPTLKSNLFSGETGGWEYIGEYAKKLRNRTTASDTKKNPLDMNIKTAVVGFGSSFAGISKNTDGSYNCEAVKNTNPDAYNACKWGGEDFGDGGFYYAENSDDIKKSIVNFVKNVTPEFSPITTGSPTLPQDALNPLRIQPYGYYASFTPKPQETTQLWAGNMNKYHIYNGQLYDTSKTISLIKTDGSLDSSAHGMWANGVKGQLPLRFGLNDKNEQIANRTILTNREITATSAVETNSLKQVNVKTLFDTGVDALFANDSKKNYWLNLLGYNVGETETVTLSDLAAKPELRQVGATMHSTPILLTQRGKVTDTLDTTDRDDYLLFGSTQGLLHVVDASTGVEKFAFVPNEMMENQPAAFLPETSSTRGSANLFYGIDAPWTAHTQYVSKTDGTLTVNSSDRTSDGSTNTDRVLTGSQWVYGGLRMGGKSYYALDLSDLNMPSLKFHIDPEHAKIYRANAATSTDVAALSYMGKSWSKPTLAYVKFGGVKKLVMFVGGGYDVGYEDAAYDQRTTTGGGAGVYMFDANTGDLLWWSSANATSAQNAEAFTDASASTINMKYSVVSQINAIDRDDDGLVDHLYFGDLGGQAFRVDLNNNATGADATAKKENFVTHVVRLFNEHANTGASPRFYEMPSFSIHEDNGYVAAVAFSSGNRSSPLSGVSGTNQFGSTTSAADGVFVVYDKDVAKYNLYDASTSVKSDAELISLNDNIGTGVAIAGHGGWKYIYSEKAGVYKGMNELHALDGMLYVNVFHRDGTGIGSDCGAGVKGDSYIYQFCLPTGKCTFSTTAVGVPNRVKIGAGILGSGLGQQSGSDTTSLVVPRPDDLRCTTDANKNKPECQQFNTRAKLRQLRWYETR